MQRGFANNVLFNTRTVCPLIVVLVYLITLSSVNMEPLLKTLLIKVKLRTLKSHRRVTDVCIPHIF